MDEKLVTGLQLMNVRINSQISQILTELQQQIVARTVPLSTTENSSTQIALLQQQIADLQRKNNEQKAILDQVQTLLGISSSVDIPQRVKELQDEKRKLEDLNDSQSLHSVAASSVPSNYNLNLDLNLRGQPLDGSPEPKGGQEGNQPGLAINSQKSASEAECDNGKSPQAKPEEYAIEDADMIVESLQDRGATQLKEEVEPVKPLLNRKDIEFSTHRLVFTGLQPNNYVTRNLVLKNISPRQLCVHIAVEDSEYYEIIYDGEYYEKLSIWLFREEMVEVVVKLKSGFNGKCATRLMASWCDEGNDIIELVEE